MGWHGPTTTQGLQIKATQEDKRFDVIADRALLNASKFLRRVYVGRIEEQDLHDTLEAIDTEIHQRLRERANEARKHRTIH